MKQKNVHKNGRTIKNMSIAKCPNKILVKYQNQGTCILYKKKSHANEGKSKILKIVLFKKEERYYSKKVHSL